MDTKLLAAQLKMLIGRQVTLYSSQWNVTGPIAAVGDDYVLIADPTEIAYFPFASLSFVELVP